MVGVAWFYSKVKGVLKKTPFFIIRTTPTITLSGIIWFWLRLTGFSPPTLAKTQILPRASRVLTIHNAGSKLSVFYVSVFRRIGYSEFESFVIFTGKVFL